MNETTRTASTLEEWKQSVRETSERATGRSPSEDFVDAWAALLYRQFSAEAYDPSFYDEYVALMREYPLS